MISRYFIDRPVLANVLAILMIVIGGVALFSLPVAQYPDVTPPTVQVTTRYPGASARTMVDTVALPIEQQVNGVENMIYMQSTSTSDGAYTLVVADFADTATAWSAYEALEAAEDGRTVEIEGVVVVKREADGKLEIQKATDHSTKSGLKWGLVGGIALGVIFPPSILGSAAALGAAGAATGKVRQLHHRSELLPEAV